MQIKTNPFDRNPNNSQGQELRTALVKLAKEYYELGVPWRHQGRNRNGVDCAGLLFAITKEATGATIEVTNYSRQPDEMMIRRIMKKFLIPWHQTPEPGDIFLVKAGYAVCHMGFFTGTTFIHADVEEKRIVEQTCDETLMRNVMGVFRVPIYRKKKEKSE